MQELCMGSFEEAWNLASMASIKPLVLFMIAWAMDN